MVTIQISSRYKEGWGKDTLSQVYFFDVAVEALANQIWMSNNSIKGLKNGNMVTKLSLYVLMIPPLLFTTSPLL